MPGMGPILWHRTLLGTADGRHTLPPVPFLGICLARHLGLLFTGLEGLPLLDDVVIVLAKRAVPLLLLRESLQSDAVEVLPTLTLVTHQDLLRVVLPPALRTATLLAPGLNI